MPANSATRRKKTRILFILSTHPIRRVRAVLHFPYTRYQLRRINGTLAFPFNYMNIHKKKTISVVGRLDDATAEKTFNYVQTRFFSSGKSARESSQIKAPFRPSFVRYKQISSIRSFFAVSFFLSRFVSAARTTEVGDANKLFFSRIHTKNSKTQIRYRKPLP